MLLRKNDWNAHKKNCKRPNYLLKFHLRPDDIFDPPIHRTLSCPSTATFAELHHALQIAFGWANTHTYDFKVKDPVAQAAWDAEGENMTQEESIMKLVQSMSNPDGPDDNVQHLLRIVEDKPFGIDRMHDRMRFNPKTPQKKSDAVRLFQVLDDAKYQGKPFEYEYDFGDCWEHEITLVGRKEATNVFACIDGEGHACAEDVGSTNGWAEFKTAFRASRPTKEQKDNMRWFKKQASYGDSDGLGNGRD